MNKNKMFYNYGRCQLLNKIFITSNIYHKICIYLYKYCIHSNTCNITMQRNDLKCRDYFFFFFF